jgi:hypothetical protein
VPLKRLPGEPPLSRRRRRLTPKTHCPHCGKRTATVRGVCTECWGGKGRARLFTIRKRGPEEAPPDPVWGCAPWWLAVLSAAVLSILRGWT